MIKNTTEGNLSHNYNTSNEVARQRGYEKNIEKPIVRMKPVQFSKNILFGKVFELREDKETSSQ